jgi:hypothetical protein
MTLDELIDRLEEYRDELGGDAEVRLMTQQNWPFKNTLAGVVSAEEINEFDNEKFRDEDVDDDQVVYLVEGDQLGYGSKRAWELAN